MYSTYVNYLSYVDHMFTRRSCYELI